MVPSPQHPMPIGRSPATRIVWLASYPRSGNTWVRFLIYNLVHGKPIFSRQVQEFIPSFHKGVEAAHFTGEYTIIKSHLRYTESMPLNSCSAGAIYVYRNPLDVMASNIGYAMRWVSDALSPTERQQQILNLTEEFVAHRGFLGWRNMGMGSWDENVESWIGAALPFPVLTVRYEDARAKTGEFVEQLCNFLGIGRTADERAEAIRNCSIDAMSAMEEAEIEHGWPGLFLGERSADGSDSWRFIGKGQSRTLKASLPEEFLNRANAAFALFLRKYGYA